jgi:hypothetical protein
MTTCRTDRQEYQTINNWRPDKDENFYFVLGPHKREGNVVRRRNPY